MSNGVRAEAQRALQSSATLLWQIMMRPDFLHCKEWSTVIFLLRPSHVCLGLFGCRSKWSRRLYLNYYVNRVVPFRRSCITMSHAPATVDILSCCHHVLVSLHFFLSRCASSISYLIFRPSMLLLRTQAVCSDVDSVYPVTRDSTRRLLHARKVLWLLYDIYVGFGIPIPSLLDPRASSFLSLPEMLSSPISFGITLFSRASYTGPIYYPTPWMVRTRYCHSAWINIGILA